MIHACIWWQCRNEAGALVQNLNFMSKLLRSEYIIFPKFLEKQGKKTSLSNPPLSAKLCNLLLLIWLWTNHPFNQDVSQPKRTSEGACEQPGIPCSYSHRLSGWMMAEVNQVKWSEALLVSVVSVFVFVFRKVCLFLHSDSIMCIIITATCLFYRLQYWACPGG